jgi:FlaA1/EpsC-like NDP-sugar epimerase
LIHLIVILEKLMEMKEVTVVGGSGLIGSELLKQLTLRWADHEVMVNWMQKFF